MRLSGRARSRIGRLLAISAGAGAMFVLLTTASACPDGTGMHAAMHAQGPRAAQTPVTAESEQVSIEIRNSDFFPRDLTIPTGAEITWVNLDSVPHDATDDGGAWGTGVLKKGQSARVRFDSPGAYSYRCTIHPVMTATLKVV